MSTILDLKSAERFKNFDFNNMYEGTVIENSTFETKGSIYVIVPELSIGSPDDIALSNQNYIDSSKVISGGKLNYNLSINHVNYIECYPIVFNGFTLGQLKPRRGSTVMVYFINGDVKMPYYLNAHLLKGEEEIMESANERDDKDHIYMVGYYRLIRIMANPMYGSDVHLVGTKLMDLGYDVKPDENGTFYYDEKMFNAILTFQRRMGMVDDGEVGPITFSTLMRYGTNKT